MLEGKELPFCCLCNSRTKCQQTERNQPSDKSQDIFIKDCCRGFMPPQCWLCARCFARISVRRYLLMSCSTGKPGYVGTGKTGESCSSCLIEELSTSLTFSFWASLCWIILNSLTLNYHLYFDDSVFPWNRQFTSDLQSLLDIGLKTQHLERVETAASSTTVRRRKIGGKSTENTLAFNKNCQLV